MSSGWESGGPGWLFDSMLIGLAWAFWSAMAFLVLQTNAHALLSKGLSRSTRRQAVGLAAVLVAGLGLIVAIDDLRQPLGPVILIVVLTGAIYATARAAYRQAEPSGEPVPWSRMVSPWKWAIPVIGAGGLVVAGWSFAAMMLMGHSV